MLIHLKTLILSLFYHPHLKDGYVLKHIKGSCEVESYKVVTNLK